MKRKKLQKRLEELLDQGKFDAIGELTAQDEKEFWDIENTPIFQDKTK